jgi:hypothetical protein
MPATIPWLAVREETVAMKTRVFDPFAAVAESGGCTFEPELGWWTQVPSAEQAGELGMPFPGQRDAIYIPTLQKNGEPVSEEVVANLKERAEKLGLTHITRAAGMWVLSETGEVQSETIWIAYGDRASSHDDLAEFAAHIRVAANQDCVAREVAGELFFAA